MPGMMDTVPRLREKPHESPLQVPFDMSCHPQGHMQMKRSSARPPNFPDAAQVERMELSSSNPKP